MDAMMEKKKKRAPFLGTNCSTVLQSMSQLYLSEVAGTFFTDNIGTGLTPSGLQPVPFARVSGFTVCVCWSLDS